MTCKFEIRGPHRLTCRAVWKLLQAFTRRHVPCAMCHQPTHDRHHRRSGVLARRMVPSRARSDQSFGRYSRKCLDTHTDWLTDWQTRPANYFFTDPPVEIFVHRTFDAEAFERSFTTGRGGGGDDRPPQRTRKLRKIATSGKRRWIGRGKFYKKYLYHFLTRSNLRSQGSKRSNLFSKSGYFRRKSQLFQ